MESKSIKTVKGLKDFLEQFDDDRRVAFQMVDGEYDRVGFLDSYSDEHSEFTKKYYLPNFEDVLLLICYGDYISSQY